MNGKPQNFNIFISYSRHAPKLRPWMQDLIRELTKKNLHVWYDEEQIKAGDPWSDALQDGLQRSQYVLMVFTPEATHSNWMAVELGASLAMEKPLIPIVSPDVPQEDLPGPIRTRKYLTLGDPAQIAEQIAQSFFPSHASNGATVDAAY